MQRPVRLPTSDRSLFDYAAMDASTARTVEQAAKRIRDHQKAAMVDIGRELNAVKEALPHGQFDQWLSAEFGWSHSTALNFMRVADTIGDKFATVAHLPPAVLYKLAAPSTPPEVRDQVLKVEAGRTVDPRDVVQFIDHAKERQKAERESQKVSSDLSPEGMALTAQKEKRQARDDARKGAKIDVEGRVAREAAQAIRDALGDRLREIVAVMQGKHYRVRDIFTEALFKPLNAESSQ